MALDNSLYDSLQRTYFVMKEYLETTQLGREHSPMILKQEELGELLERLDIEAIEEQTKDIHSLHDKLNAIMSISEKVSQDIGSGTDSVILCENAVKNLDEIFIQINPMIAE